MRPMPPVLAGLPSKEKFPCRNGLISSGFKLRRKNQTTARGMLMLESLYQDISRRGTVDPRSTAARFDEQAAPRNIKQYQELPSRVQSHNASLNVNCRQSYFLLAIVDWSQVGLGRKVGMRQSRSRTFDKWNLATGF